MNTSTKVTFLLSWLKALLGTLSKTIIHKKGYLDLNNQVLKVVFVVTLLYASIHFNTTAQ